MHGMLDIPPETPTPKTKLIVLNAIIVGITAAVA